MSGVETIKAEVVKEKIRLLLLRLKKNLSKRSYLLENLPWTRRMTRRVRLAPLVHQRR